MQKEIPLNNKQLEAVHSNEENVLIIAPAGSGKTTTLVAAIKKYKDENPTSKVVAITFTRKSAEDLRNKLTGYRWVEASTIHSWAYSELEKLAIRVREEDINNSFKIKLLQEDKIREILQDLMKKRRYLYIKVGVLYSYIMGNYNMDISDRLKTMFKALHTDYINYKETYGLYDFTDLPKYLLDKLNDYSKDIEGIDALFVDEFQDVDDVQIETFHRVKAEKKFYIGDPAQSIYIFRGATQDVIKQVKDFQLHNLDVNYRSNQEIIDFATTFQERAMKENVMLSAQLESYKSKINCENGEGGRVYIVNRAGVAYKVNEYIKESGIDLVEKMLNDNAMILCRKNKEVKTIKALGYDKVQTVHQAKGLEYPKVIVTDFDMRGIEDINIAYVAMTRAKTDLVAANYEAFVLILEKLKRQNRLKTNILF